MQNTLTPAPPVGISNQRSIPVYAWKTYAVLFIYIFTATLTQYDFNRVIIADIFLLVVLLPMALYRGIRFNNSDFIYLAFLICLFLSTYLAKGFNEDGVVEFVAITFAAFGFFIIKSIVIGTPGVSVGGLIQVWLYAAFFSACIGLTDLLFLDSVIEGHGRGLVIGTFRNQGQSGTYFMFALVAALPAYFARLIKPNAANAVMIGIVIIALALTFRRSATIALTVGCIAFMVFGSGGISIKKVAGVLILGVGALWAVNSVITTSELTFSRYNQKYGRLRDDVLNEEGWLAGNVGGALDAFYDNPAFGAGIGNIVDIYTENHEIHNTFLWILSQGGLVGLSLFLLWGAMVAANFFSIRKICAWAKIAEPTHQFILYATPFLFSVILVSSHARIFRLREFWYLLVVLALATYLVERFNMRRMG